MQTSSDIPATPTLPDHFDQEARLQFLYSFLNPDIDQFRVAELAGLKLSEYFAYINSEEFQERLAQQTSIAEQRARACATLAQPKAVATLTHIIDSYNEAERDILLGRQPIALNIRQRHRESARRASWLILKLTGAIPTHLRAARPIREQSTPDRERGPAQAPLTTTLSDALTQHRELAAAYPASQIRRGEPSIEDPPRPTQHRRFAVANSDSPEPAFIKSHRLALERRAAELDTLEDAARIEALPAETNLHEAATDSASHPPATPTTPTPTQHRRFDVANAASKIRRGEHSIEDSPWRTQPSDSPEASPIQAAANLPFTPQHPPLPRQRALHNAPPPTSG